MLRAVGRAEGEAVQSLAAGVGVPAAVAPGETLELPLRMEQLAVEVDVLPPESQGFALPESHAETDDPPHERGPLDGGPQEGFRLFDRERFASVSSTLSGSTRVATFSPMIRRRWAIFRARDRMRWTLRTWDSARLSSSVRRYICSRCSGWSLSSRCRSTPGMMSLRVSEGRPCVSHQH